MTSMIIKNVMKFVISLEFRVIHVLSSKKNKRVQHGNRLDCSLLIPCNFLDLS